MNQYEIESNTLPVFDCPSFTGDIVGRLFRGDQMTAEPLGDSLWAEIDFAGQRRYVCVSPVYTTQITGVDWRERYLALRDAVNQIEPLIQAIRSTVREGLLDS